MIAAFYLSFFRYIIINNVLNTSLQVNLSQLNKTFFALLDTPEKHNSVLSYISSPNKMFLDCGVGQLCELTAEQMMFVDTNVSELRKAMKINGESQEGDFVHSSKK